MDKLELLSNIRTKELNTKSITNFFETIKAVEEHDNSDVAEHVIKASELREDKVVSSTDEEKELIMSNFPKKQGTYLVVPKIIQ